MLTPTAHSAPDGVTVPRPGRPAALDLPLASRLGSLDESSKIRQVSQSRQEATVDDVIDAIEVDETTEIEDELLVEEISIDGMCGVY